MNSSASPDPVPPRTTLPAIAPRVSPWVLVALGLLGCSKAEPNTVLLISLDTLRADAGLFEDREVAPNLARLAERGMHFTQATSGSSWTLPAHAQMFTGQPPILHGVEDDNVRIDPRTATLPERFFDAGWRTFGAFTGWYLVGDFGFSRGFEVYENRMQGGNELERALADTLKISDSEQASRIWEAGDLQSHRAITSAQVGEFATSALKECKHEDLFLFLHFFDPHYDYIPPAPYDTRFDPDYTGTIDGRDFWKNPRIQKDGVRTISDRDLDHIRALYLGEITWTDEHLGRLLDQLDAEGRSAGTTVALVSDHGEEFFEHGGRGHRQTLFDEVLRVPFLLVPAPRLGLSPASTSDLPISLSDLAPTLLDLSGLPALPDAAGRSLAPLLRGETLAPRAQFASLRSRPLVMGQADRNVTRHRLVETWRSPREKLIRESIVRDGVRRLQSLTWYDLERDPEEQSPLQSPDDPRLLPAWQALEAEIDRLRGIYGQAPHSEPQKRATRARELFAGQLEDLGYVQVGGDANGEMAVDRLPWGFSPPPAWPFEMATKSLDPSR